MLRAKVNGLCDKHAAICTCPTECDCQNPEPIGEENGVAHVSNECPTHNFNPQAAPDCTLRGSHLNGAIDK